MIFVNLFLTYFQPFEQKFEAAMAYQILTSCSFGPAVRTRFFVKLLKNITLTECDRSKILQAVQDVYGYEKSRITSYTI
ncbi:hypothetical protein [Orientia tsutsugamushi]|uniref:Uncharacterized protein n=1 Tax=Orientia tsutsugamushi TaxID=784 RepID=A0A2U3QVT4_ORITS|nr:hypothetical protein [Orientia tsutsugamushi]SPR05048.1 Uncharacterised protein [Orientia tsutsugamushi]